MLAGYEVATEGQGGGGARPLREALLVGALLVVVAAVGFGWVHHLSVKLQSETVEQELFRLAAVAAALVDGERHRQLRAPAQTDGDLYRELLAPLLAFHRAVPDLHYVYTVTSVDDQPRFVLDTAKYVRDLRPDVPLTPSVVMEVYEKPDPDMLAALELGVVRVGELHRDEFGTFISGFAPFFDDDRELAGVVGVDLAAHDYLQRFTPVLQATLHGLAASLLLAVLITLLVYRMRSITRCRELIYGEERRREARKLLAQYRENERLLANILPAAISARLKAGEELIADAHERVTVVFVDLAGFAAYSSSQPARRVVDTLNRVFSMMDDLSLRYRLEKIKTIGDAYMVVGGLDPMDDDHFRRVADMALEMVERFRAVMDEMGIADLGIRVGVATGPAVAGVIGSVKFAYDLWGDTVNTASRLEASSMPGKIHCNERFVGSLGSGYRFDRRGATCLKGKGDLVTYFLLSREDG